MPTILTHPAVPLAIAVGLGRETVSRKLLAAGVVASVLADIDVLGFHFGISYGAVWGHRGLTHSLFFALIIAVLGAGLSRHLASRPKTAFWFLLATAGSHGILDAFTNGGLGIALLWPFSPERLFAPFRPIEVSPLSLSGILSMRGITVLWSEVLWVWLPCLFATSLALAYRYHRALIQRFMGRENRARP